MQASKMQGFKAYDEHLLWETLSHAQCNLAAEEFLNSSLSWYLSIYNSMIWEVNQFFPSSSSYLSPSTGYALINYLAVLSEVWVGRATQRLL